MAGLYDPKRAYYAKTATFTHVAWTREQERFLFLPDLTDPEISRMTGHSVAAIQKHRWKLLRGQGHPSPDTASLMRAYKPKKRRPALCADVAPADDCRPSTGRIALSRKEN